MLNMKKLLTKILNRFPVYSNLISSSYKNTTANAWEYTNLKFNVPAGHVYLVRCTQGWSSGRPMGIGLNPSASLTGGAPQYCMIDRSGSAAYICNSPTWICPGSATYYLYTYRDGASSTANAYYVNVIDIPTA